VKILLVEDNEVNREMLTRRLIRRNFIVEIACDGEEGINMALTCAPDVILMDMSLPKIDGWNATYTLKHTASTKHIPIIALTAHAMADDKRKALDAGCDDYDTKPIDLDRLLAKIDAVYKRCPEDL